MVIKNLLFINCFRGVRVACTENCATGIAEGTLGTARSYNQSGVYVLWDPADEESFFQLDQLKLRVYDVAQCKITHSFVSCNACGEWPISGLRWKCTVCDNMDLCSQCYHSDSHDLEHEFSCITVSWSGGNVGHLVRRRSESKKVALIGILPGARVVRGRDWNWADQDAVESSTGTVTEYFNEHQLRGTVYVKWDSDLTQTASVGTSGYVDLKLVETPPDIYFVYLDHLPLLRTYLQDGFPACASMVTEPSSASAANFGNGSYVRVSDDLNAVKKLQAGHGEWVNCMSSVLGQVGKVVGKTGSGDVRVNFGQLTFTVNAAVLTAAEREIGVYYVNDYVKVKSQVRKLRRCQRDAGLQQCSRTERIAGSVGRVTSVLLGNRVQVIIKAQKYCFSASALRLVSSVPDDVFVCGDVVHVLNDYETVKTLQYGHGGWTDDMSFCLDRQGRVLLVDDVDDVLVSINDNFCYFNPAVLKKVSPISANFPELNELELRISTGECCNLLKCQELVICHSFERDDEFLVTELAEENELTSDDESSSDEAVNDELADETIANEEQPNDVQARNLEQSSDGLESGEQTEVAETQPDLENLCRVCRRVLKDIIFQCGHGSCENCAKDLQTCPFCNQSILIKIKMR